MLSDSMVAVSLAVGAETGLLDNMVSHAEPRTSQQIADDAGLKERLSSCPQLISVCVCLCVCVCVCA